MQKTGQQTTRADRYLITHTNSVTVYRFIIQFLILNMTWTQIMVNAEINLRQI